MRLNELNNLAREAENHERAASTCKVYVGEIRAERAAELPLPEALTRLKRYERQGSVKVAALERAEALLRDDLFRVAEIDLEAQARGHIATAKAKRAQLALYCGEGDSAALNGSEVTS